MQNVVPYHIHILIAVISLVVDSLYGVDGAAGIGKLKPDFRGVDIRTDPTRRIKRPLRLVLKYHSSIHAVPFSSLESALHKRNFRLLPWLR